MNSTGRVQVGHPVDVGSGAVFTEMDDFVLPGTLRLTWARFYATDLDVDAWLGRSWVVPWFSSLMRVDGGYLLVDERGRNLFFPVDAAQDGATLRVINYGANMTLTRRDNHLVVEHWHYGTDDVEWFYFADRRNGRPMPLAWLQNVFGHRVRLKYDSLDRPVQLVQELEERIVELEYG